jgi:hypothetical protein
MSETDRRKGLFTKLDSVLGVSEKKFKSEKKGDGLRLKWGRLMVNAIGVYGRLLDTEELELRVEKLESQIKDGVLIPSEEHKQETKQFRR